MALIIILTLIQAGFMSAVFVYPPYSIPWMNKSLKITQVLYSVLNLLFIVLIGFGERMTQEIRYYGLGTLLIAAVLSIIIVNIAYSVYSVWLEVREWWSARKNNKVLSDSVK